MRNKSVSQRVLRNRGCALPFVVYAGAGHSLLSAKDNQPILKAKTADFVQSDALHKATGTVTQTEKNRERIETRIGFATDEIDWLHGREGWANLSCIGAIHTRFSTKDGENDE